jgi:hypothetical protein
VGACAPPTLDLASFVPARGGGGARNGRRGEVEGKEERKQDLYTILEENV